MLYAYGVYNYVWVLFRVCEMHTEAQMGVTKNPSIPETTHQKSRVN